MPPPKIQSAVTIAGEALSSRFALKSTRARSTAFSLAGVSITMRSPFTGLNSAYQRLQAVFASAGFFAASAFLRAALTSSVSKSPTTATSPLVVATARLYQS